MRAAEAAAARFEAQQRQKKGDKQRRKENGAETSSMGAQTEPEEGSLQSLNEYELNRLVQSTGVVTLRGIWGHSHRKTKSTLGFGAGGWAAIFSTGAASPYKPFYGVGAFEKSRYIAALPTEAAADASNSTLMTATAWCRVSLLP